MDSISLPADLATQLENEEIGAQYLEIPVEDMHEKLIVAYYPLRFVKDDYYILYFLDISRTLKPYYNRMILISALSLLIIVFLTFAIIRSKS